MEDLPQDISNLIQDYSHEMEICENTIERHKERMREMRRYCYADDGKLGLWTRHGRLMTPSEITDFYFNVEFKAILGENLRLLFGPSATRGSDTYKMFYNELHHFFTNINNDVLSPIHPQIMELFENYIYPGMIGIHI